MRILRNYILREFLGPFFSSLAVLTLMMLLGNLVRLADLIINKGVNLFSVIKLFGFLIPALLTYTVPIAVLVAVLLSLSRLSSDNEIIALRTNGVNILHLIIMPLIIIGLILSLVMVICNDRIIPYAHFALRRTLNSIGIKSPTAALEAGTFIDTFNKYIIFIYHIDGNQLHQVRIYEPQTDKRPCRTIVAKRGEFVSLPEKGMVKLKLIDGASDEPDPNNPTRFYKLNFKTLFMNLNISESGKSRIEKKAKDMTFREMNYLINKFKTSGIEITPLIIEKNKRISLAFSVIIFILIGSALAMLTRRKEKSINFSMAFGVAAIYYILLLGTTALALEGYIGPSLAMWLPNLILGTVGFLLMFRICEY